MRDSERIKPVRVSAAEFVRNFAQMRENALVEPVVISSHGRETHVLCSADSFHRQQAASPVAADGQTEWHIDNALELADWVDEGIIACDAQLNVVFANTLAHNLTGNTAGSLTDRPLPRALPQIAGGLLETQARRTLRLGEISLLDVPSPFIADAWLRVHCFRLKDHLVLRLRDVTIEAESRFKANVKEAILEAMEVHGDIFYLRLSARGTIDRACKPFQDLIGLPLERLTGARLADLVTATDRPALRDELEAVLRDQGSRCIAASLVSNAGEALPVDLSLVHLRGIYGSEGVAVLCTRAHAGQANPPARADQARRA